MVPTLAALVGAGQRMRPQRIASPASTSSRKIRLRATPPSHRPPDVQQPPGRALGIDARHLAGIGLLHLLRQARRGRGALSLRRVRASPRHRPITTSCAPRRRSMSASRSFHYDDCDGAAARSRGERRSAGSMAAGPDPNRRRLRARARASSRSSPPDVQAEWHRTSPFVPIQHRRVRLLMRKAGFYNVQPGRSRSFGLRQLAFFGLAKRHAQLESLRLALFQSAWGASASSTRSSSPTGRAASRRSMR